MPGSRLTASLRAAWTSLTASPRRAAIAMVVLVGSVVVGGGLAVAVGAVRDVGAAPSPTLHHTVAAVSATPSPTVSVTPEPSLTSRPSPPATESPTVSPSASAATASPSSSGPGGSTVSPSPSLPTVSLLTGTWEPLPTAPNPRGVRAQSAIRLEDGRIAVIHWDGSDPGSGDCIAVYSPGTETWDIPAVVRAVPTDSCAFDSTSKLVPHSNGRLYGLASVVDPTVDPWTVEDTPWRGQWTMPSSIGTTTDGRLYGPDNLDGVVQLYEFDVVAGVLELVSEYDPTPLDDVVAGIAPRLYIGTNDYSSRTSPLASYDPATGEWRDEGRAPFTAGWESAAHGPNGWIFVLDSSELLWARDAGTREWVQVELPGELPPHWDPAFVDGGDGRLYAFDARQPFVFSPGQVAKVPSR